MSAPFPGEARPLPVPTGRSGVLSFGPSDGEPDPRTVRHAAGYAAFMAAVERSGADAAVLAGDLEAFAAWIRASGEALDDPAIRDSAAVFLGNLLIVLHPRASWRVTPDLEVGTDAISVPVGTALERLQEDPGRAARMTTELLPGWDRADARADDAERALEAVQAATDATPLADAPAFVRPAMEVGPFLDERGEVIPYGTRWRTTIDDEPPQEAYSRVTHPERFAPLHDVADALVAHLERHYEVAVLRSTDADGDRVVTLRPVAGAPVRLAFTGFPGLRLRAGLLLSQPVPDCGCDACDETTESAAASLEETVLAVVRGGYAERAPDGEGTGATSLRLPDGGGRGSGMVDLPDDPLVDPAVVVALGGAAWPAWPLRS